MPQEVLGEACQISLCVRRRRSAHHAAEVAPPEMSRPWIETNTSPGCTLRLLNLPLPLMGWSTRLTRAPNCAPSCTLGAREKRVRNGRKEIRIWFNTLESHVGDRYCHIGTRADAARRQISDHLNVMPTPALIVMTRSRLRTLGVVSSPGSR